MSSNKISGSVETNSMDTREGGSQAQQQTERLLSAGNETVQVASTSGVHSRTHSAVGDPKELINKSHENIRLTTNGKTVFPDALIQ